jgi:cytoskeletal protein RodZ
MNQNNGHHRVSAVDVIEEERASEQIGSNFYDANSPEFRPARQIDVRQKKSWKRKLVGGAVVPLLICGAAISLYLLLRVNRVNVKVQADARPDSQNARPKTDATNSENGLTAEAINIARNASGTDTANPTASPAASPAPSPSLVANNGRSLSFTLNSPATEPFNDASTNGNTNQQLNSTVQASQASAVSATTALPQSRANATASIFVDDSVLKLGIQPPPATSISSRVEKKTTPAISLKPPPTVVPPFGTMLPVRTQGVLFTVRNNSYARLELTRDCSGAGWSLPKGTVLVGRTSGSEYDRAFVNVIGYIDPRDNKLVKMTGEALGADGATGIPGKRIGVDRNRLKQTLRKVASNGVQIAGTMAGALTGRGTVVIDSAGYGLMNPISSDARTAIGGNEQRTFVKVMAGQPAYVMVADLPKSVQTVDAPGDDEILQAAGSLSDRDVMELILFGSPDEIRAALPLMTDEQKRLASKTLAPGD